MPRKRGLTTRQSRSAFGHPGKRTEVRSVDQLLPLEIVLEVRGTQAIPTNFRVVAQRAVRPIT
jgi:hypothetical protein